jgi:hypothetical protein
LTWEDQLSLFISKVQADSSSLNGAEARRTIFTFFGDGLIIELPTRWVRAISFEPRYSPLTVNQYAHNIKDFLLWLAEAERYQSLWLDMVLVAVTRRDLQEWILSRKAALIQGSTLRSREIAVKLFLEWLTTQEAGSIRTPENTPYKTGKLISPAAQRRSPQYISSEMIFSCSEATTMKASDAWLTRSSILDFVSLKFGASEIGTYPSLIIFLADSSISH